MHRFNINIETFTKSQLNGTIFIHKFNKDNLKLLKKTYNEQDSHSDFVESLFNCICGEQTLALPIKYNHNETNIGRLYGDSVGLQNCEYTFKLILLSNYIEIDGCNTWLMIIIAITDAYGVNAEYFKHYIKNKEMVCNDLKLHYGLTQKQSKRLILNILFNETINWKEHPIFKSINELPPFVFNLAKQALEIRNWLSSKNKGIQNVMHKICEHFEVQILEVMVETLKSYNIITANECILQYDGVMVEVNKIPSNKSIRKEILDGLHNNVLRKCGIDIYFQYKIGINGSNLGSN